MATTPSAPCFTQASAATAAGFPSVTTILPSTLACRISSGVPLPTQTRSAAVSVGALQAASMGTMSLKEASFRRRGAISQSSPLEASQACPWG